jgi:hypothetical protein
VAAARAAGEALPLTQDELAIDGHAIEARISAENPDAGFLPATGRLEVYRLPPAIEFARGADAQVRVDGGVREGDTITPHYDPMIAKLIVHGRDRAEALARLDAALAQTRSSACRPTSRSCAASCERVVRERRSRYRADRARAGGAVRAAGPADRGRRRPASSPMRSQPSARRRAPIRGRAATAGACTAARCAASTSPSVPSTMSSRSNGARDGAQVLVRNGERWPFRRQRADATGTTSCSASVAMR